MVTTLTSYLTFRLGDETFAAPVDKVLEILDIPKITRVPRSPDFMLGVVNLRGSVLPVIDTRIKFGLPVTELTATSCIVVMHIMAEDHEVTIGALTDSVHEVLEVDETQIQEIPSIGARYKTEFVQGMARKGDQFIMILDVDKVFTTDEATILKEASAENDNTDTQNQ